MSRLWALTSYYNPSGYQQRLRNYKVFRSHIGAPLATVELSFNGKFELEQNDADHLIQLHGGDIMWQKERLLNLLVRQLPAECDQVAWVDCDIVFEADDWWQRASEKLNDVELLHLYSYRINLPRDVSPWDVLPADVELLPSIVHLNTIGIITDSWIQRTPGLHGTEKGLAWAASRKLLTDVGLYDACVIGGGDRTIVSAALQRPELAINHQGMNKRQVAHYLQWAQPFFSAVGSQSACLDGRILHLWHGDLVNRQYSARHKILTTSDFDPARDISLTPDGLWQWASDKPEMHASIKAYFDSRKEDG